MPCKNCKGIGHNSRTCKIIKPEGVAVNVEDDLIIPVSPIAPIISNKKYYCYIVKQVEGTRDLTYVGYTVNPSRRIRQHGGFLTGGARYTQLRGPWEFLVVMYCPLWSNIKAMQNEWLIKHPTRKRKTPKCFYGAKGRINSLIEVFKRIPEEEKIEMYVHTDYYDQAVNLNLPVNVNIRAKLDF